MSVKAFFWSALGIFCVNALLGALATQGLYALASWIARPGLESLARAMSLIIFLTIQLSMGFIVCAVMTFAFNAPVWGEVSGQIHARMPAPWAGLVWRLSGS